MSETLRSALLISVIGMGLIFGVILLLWALIAVIVRVGADRPAAQGEMGDEAARLLDDEASARERATAVAAVTVVTVAREREGRAAEAKARAAAAAVSAYLADEHRKP